MDYRSVIQLSYENKEKALKEVRKSSNTNGSVTKKPTSGPSDAAIKKFLNKKEEEKKEWFEKLKVVKPSNPKPKSKNKVADKKNSDVKQSMTETKRGIQENTAEVVKLSNGLNEKVRKKDANYSETIIKKDSSNSELVRKKDSDYRELKKKSVKCDDVKKRDVLNSEILRKKDLCNNDMRKEAVNKRETETKRDVSSSAKVKKIEGPKTIPSFSKYADLLALANQNASKPSTDWLDPDAADKREAVKKKKKEKSEAEERLTGDLYAKLPSKKRKTDALAEYAPSVKKAKSVKSEQSDSTTFPKPSTSISKVSSSSVSRSAPTKLNPSSSSLQISKSHAPSSGSKTNQKLSSSDLKSTLSNKSKEPPSIPPPPPPPAPPARKGIAAQLSKPQVTPSPKVVVPKGGSGPGRPAAPPQTARPGPTTAQTARPKPTAAPQTAPLPAKRPAMSVTMEDADSNFVQYSRKREMVPLRPPPPTAPPVRRGGGIASQNAFGAVPIVKKSKNAKFRFSEVSSDVDEDDYDDEDEYDEDDDFIDDSECVSANQYNDVVKEIHRSLRFDPNKYEKVTRFDDLRSMESNYKDIEKEEKRSARLGMKEDLEDIRAEQERLKRKKQKHN